jgi:hypothetical protein
MSAQWSERFDAVVQRQARTIARLNASPGVESAAFSQLLPAARDVPPNEFQIYGRDPREKTFALGRSGEFRLLPDAQHSGAQGRHVRQRSSGAGVLDARWSRERSPIGTNPSLRTRSASESFSPGQLSNRTTKIVGIVGDVRESGALNEAEPLIYWCGYNPYWPDQYFLVRTRSDRHVSMAAIREALKEIEPSAPSTPTGRSHELLCGIAVAQRLNAILLALFAANAHSCSRRSASTVCFAAGLRSRAARLASAWRSAHGRRASCQPAVAPTAAALTGWDRRPACARSLVLRAVSCRRW